MKTTSPQAESFFGYFEEAFDLQQQMFASRTEASALIRNKEVRANELDDSLVVGMAFSYTPVYDGTQPADERGFAPVMTPHKDDDFLGRLPTDLAERVVSFGDARDRLAELGSAARREYVGRKVRIVALNSNAPRVLWRPVTAQMSIPEESAKGEIQDLRLYHGEGYTTNMPRLLSMDQKRLLLPNKTYHADVVTSVNHNGKLALERTVDIEFIN